MLSRLGKYIIKSELGRGAMGIVYLAEDPRLHRPVALKTMSAGVAGNAELLKRFYREAESVGQLQHPNIVTVYDIDEADGVPFIAMQYLEGDSLEQVIHSRKDLPGFVKIDLIVQTCRGLHYAHKRGIVHRDIKPANIMVLNDGTVKIMDFGIAHINTASMTRSGLVLGTPMYMSPEQIRGDTVDARNDIFAVGVTLYELLTYKKPFYADNMQAIIYRVLSETPPPISTLVEGYPAALDEIIARAMAKQRDQRYESAEELAGDLQQQGDSMKRHTLDTYVQDGQRFVAAGNLEQAQTSLQKALGIDSTHKVARNVMQRVQQLQLRQKGEKVERGLREAQAALQDERFDRALDLLEEVLRFDPGNASALSAKQSALAQRDRRQQIANYLERAETLAAQGDLSGAQAAAEKLLALDSRHERALQLLNWAREELAEQQRQAEVRRYFDSAQACVSRNDFAGALNLMEKAKALDPGNPEVDSLLNSIRVSRQQEERKNLLNQKTGEIQRMLSGGDFDGAVALADACLEEFPGDSRTVKLRAEAARQADIQRNKRFIDEQIRAAADFFQKSDYAAAAAIVEEALARVPGDARLVAYLKSVQDAQKVSAFQEVRRSAAGQANEMIRRKDYAGAVQVLEAAFERAGLPPDLVGLLKRARLQAAAQQRERQELVRQAVTGSHALLKDEKYDEAIRVLEECERETSAAEVTEALSNARLRRQRYQEQREEILRQALDHLHQGDAAQAVSVLDAAPKGYFNDARFSEIYSQCTAELNWRSAIRQTTEQVEKYLAEEDWSEAERVLRAALDTYPNDPTLLENWRKLDEAMRRHNLASKLADAQLAYQQGQYAETRELLSPQNWQAADFPDLEQQAAALIENARQRELEAAQARADEARQREEALTRTQEQAARQREWELTQALAEEARQREEAVARARAEEAWQREQEVARAREEEARQRELEVARAREEEARQREVAVAQAREKEARQREIELARTREEEARQREEAVAQARAEEAQQREFELAQAQRELELSRAREEESRLREAAVAEERAEEARQRDWELAQAREEEARQREAAVAEARAEEARQRELELARAREEEARQREAAVAKARAEEAKRRELEVAKAREEEARQREAAVAKARAEEAKRRELEVAKAREEEAKQREAAVAKARAEEAKRREQEVAKAKEEAKQREAAVAKARAEETRQRDLELAKARREKDEATQRVLEVTSGIMVAPPKRSPMGLWVGIGVIVVAFAGLGLWRMSGGSSKPVGYVQVTAVPWAEVVGVKTKEGQALNLEGQTPLQLELPPGDYVIQLKTDQGVGQEEVNVKPGEVVPVRYVSPMANSDAWVDDLVSK